jgi:DNA polymerase-1
MVTSGAALESALSELARHPRLGVDTETTGLDPYRSRVRLLQVATEDVCFVIDLFRVNALTHPGIRSLLVSPHPIKVFHNAKFDVKMLLHHFNIETHGIFDTYLASQLVDAGIPEISHSLAALCDRRLGLQIDKSARLSDWAGELSEAQCVYAAKDAEVVLPLSEQLSDRLSDLNLGAAAKLEFDCVLPITAMELAGMPIDPAKWQVLTCDLKRAHAKLSAELKRELAAGILQLPLFGEPEINLDSPAQIIEALGNMGIKVEGTRGWQLQGLAKDHPAVAKLIEYRAAHKALSSYGAVLLDHVNPVTGRIHADFRSIGATGGRMSCSDPNLQQIPNSPEYRACFCAPAGRKLITADYSQIEMRILADWSQDTALVKALVSGEDLHRVTASQMLGVPLDAVTKEQRAVAKQLNYGLVYGLGPQGLAARIECSIEEAEELIHKYFAAYSGVADWLREAADRAVTDKENRTRSGRLIRFVFDPADRTQVAATARLGKNAPIQGSSADIIKRALALLHEALK